MQWFISFLKIVFFSQQTWFFLKFHQTQYNFFYKECCTMKSNQINRKFKNILEQKPEKVSNFFKKRPFEVRRFSCSNHSKEKLNFFNDTEKNKLENSLICRKKNFLSVKLKIFYRTSFLKVDIKNVIGFSSLE